MDGNTFGTTRAKDTLVPAAEFTVTEGTVTALEFAVRQTPGNSVLTRRGT
ncbi:MAG: hypothetical protein RLZ55_409 [Actinomycetota bacterium]|jgi:hypothetical protein